MLLKKKKKGGGDKCVNAVNRIHHQYKFKPCDTTDTEENALLLMWNQFKMLTIMFYLSLNILWGNVKLGGKLIYCFLGNYLPSRGHCVFGGNEGRIKWRYCTISPRASWYAEQPSRTYIQMYGSKDIYCCVLLFYCFLPGYYVASLRNQYYQESSVTWYMIIKYCKHI